MATKKRRKKTGKKRASKRAAKKRTTKKRAGKKSQHRRRSQITKNKTRTIYIGPLTGDARAKAARIAKQIVEAMHAAKKSRKRRSSKKTDLSKVVTAQLLLPR